MLPFSRLDLLNTSIHEAYPGHYVRFLWLPHLPSKVRQVIGCGTNAEGWAHYCEQGIHSFAWQRRRRQQQL